MLKLFYFLILFIPFSLNAQVNLYKIARDSDAVYISHKEIALNKVTIIEFIETLDTLCFKNYPLPPASVQFIKNTCNFNSEGLCEYYNWSFSEKKIIEQNEADVASGHFFIPNEYEYSYSSSVIKNLNVSDASSIRNIVYKDDKDSIFVYTTYNLTTDKTIVKEYAFPKDTSTSKIIYSHTGNKQIFFPKHRICDLGIVYSSSIFINHIPVTSFLSEKYEQKRFLIEINPALSIFFELVE